MSRTSLDRRLSALEQRYRVAPAWRVVYLRPEMTDTEAAASKAAALRDAPFGSRLIAVTFVKPNATA